MSTSVSTIRRWLEQAQNEGATHIVVVCDTFSHEDYPVNVMPEEDAQDVSQSYNNPGNMSQVMEVYNLSKDWDEQLSRVRCWEF